MSAILVTLFTSGSTSAVPVELGSLTEPRAHGLAGLGGDEERAVQVEQLFRATQVSVFARGNRQEKLALNVIRIHASVRAAFRWWLLHPRSCPIKVDVRFQQDDAEEWLIACGLASVRRVERPSGGLTTVFGYELVGGSWGANRTAPYQNPNLV